MTRRRLAGARADHVSSADRRGRNHASEGQQEDQGTPSDRSHVKPLQYARCDDNLVGDDYAPRNIRRGSTRIRSIGKYLPMASMCSADAFESRIPILSVTPAEILVLIAQHDNDLGVKLRTDLIGHALSLWKFHGTVAA
jgi:hypothetical protein